MVTHPLKSHVKLPAVSIYCQWSSKHTYMIRINNTITEGIEIHKRGYRSSYIR